MGKGGKITDDMWVRFWLRNKVQKILARIGMQEVIGV
jgi:hypothetical protein